MIVRELFALLGLKVDEQSFAKGQLAVEVLKVGASKLYSAIEGAASQFTEFVRSTAAAGKEIHETSQAVGVSTKALQELRGAAKATGVDSGDLDTGLRILARTLYAASKGGEEAQKSLKAAGASAKDAHGKIKPTDEVLGEVAQKFAKMPDGAEKTALAMQIFGRSGASLIPMLNKGAAGLDELRSKAFVMSAEQLEAGRQLTMSLAKLSSITKKLWTAAIAPLLPAITELVEKFVKWKQENAEIIKGAIQKSLKVLLAIVKAIGVVFAALVKTGKALAENWKILATIAGTVLAAALLKNLHQLKQLALYYVVVGATAIDAAIDAAVAWIAAVGPFIALALAIGAVILILQDLYTWATGGKSVFGALYEEFDKFLRRWVTTPSDWWIVAKLKEAMQWMYKINDQMQSAMRSIRDNWDALGDHIVGAIRRGAEALVNSPIGRIVGAIRRGAEALVNSPIGRIAGAVTGVQLPATATPTTAAPSAGAMANYQTALGGIHTVVNVQQAQGASAADTGQTVAQMVDAANRRMLREAAGAIPGG